MLIAFGTHSSTPGKDSSVEIRRMEDWNQRAVDGRLETPRVWQLTNKRVSTRIGVRRLRFLSLITIAIASRRSDGVSPRLPRSPTTSTATGHRKCESSVMGNWSEQTRIEDFVKRGTIARVVITVSFSAIVPQILRDAYLKFRCHEPEGRETIDSVLDSFWIICNRCDAYIIM